MSDFFRVNVSSATSTTSIDEDDNKKAELVMQLPGNLIAHADSVKYAKMALMKLQVPLSKIPVCSLPVTGPNELDPFVDLDACVAILPGAPLQNVISPEIPRQYWVHQSFDQWNVTYLSAIPNNVHLTNSAESPRAREIRLHNHDFYSFADLFNIFEIALRDNFEQNYAGHFPSQSEQPLIKFTVNSDNTLTLEIRPQTELIALPSVKYPSDRNYDSTFIQQTTNFGHYKSDGEDYDFYDSEDYEFVPYTIGVSPSIAERLPNLPWLKRKNFLANFPYEYIYFLNTANARVELGSSITRKVNRILSPSIYYTNLSVKYHFPESDVISMVNISSLILVMNGASFNQQVFPVNFSDTTSRQAQISQIPIIEVYYPFLTHPSDHTSTLYISKESFSDAAPININPSLLKERVLSFKLFYITMNGEMKEILLPPFSTFTFQLAFELIH